MSSMRIVLEYPGRGNFAPVKFATTQVNYIKTPVEGLPKEIWVANGKVYDLGNPEEVKEFNEMCEKAIPNAYEFDMHVTPRVLPPVPKKKAPSKPKAKKASSKTPTAPALIGPPSGGES